MASLNELIITLGSDIAQGKIPPKAHVAIRKMMDRFRGKHQVLRAEPAGLPDRHKCCKFATQFFSNGDRAMTSWQSLAPAYTPWLAKSYYRSNIHLGALSKVKNLD
jgi:hypothetical protein